jgi:hypothetical protein
MTYVHKELAAGRWFTFSFLEQMAHTGSEVERTMLWRERDRDRSNSAFERALELLDLTIADPRNRRRLRELCRLREVLVDYFFGDNQYGSSDKLWRSYFLPFAYAARRGR